MRAFLLGMIWVTLAGTGARAQTTSPPTIDAHEAKAFLTKALTGRDLPLRGFPGGATVDYRYVGGGLETVTGLRRMPGVFRMKSVETKQAGGQLSRVTIKGSRGLALELEGNKIAHTAFSFPVTLTIDLAGAGDDAVTKLEGLLFYPSLQAMVDDLPEPWRDTVPACALDVKCRPDRLDKRRWIQDGGTWLRAPLAEVVGPEVTYTPEPEFTEEARRSKLSGTVLVGMELDLTGKLVSIWLLSPLGYGLEESALEAAAQYKFKPA